MRSLATVIVLVANAAAQQPPTPMHPDGGVVLAEDQARTFAKPRLCSRPGPGVAESVWMPDEATIRRLETALGPALQKAVDALPVRHANAADYYRQYAGLVVAGKRIVYINGMHADAVERVRTPMEWRTKAIFPCDGGTLFFGAEFNVETGAVEKIVFHPIRVR